MRGRYAPEIPGSLDYGLGPPLNTFEAINLGGDGMTPLVPFKDADHLKDHRKRDLDNLLLSCAPWEEGLIEAGVLFYDDKTHLEHGGVSLVSDDHDETIITLQEII